MTFATIQEALADIAAGKMIIVVDDEERENEGDFITAAETVTPEQVNFIAREAGIQLCVGLTRDRFEQLTVPGQHHQGQRDRHEGNRRGRTGRQPHHRRGDPDVQRRPDRRDAHRGRRDRFEQLSIPMMVADNTAPHQTAFGVSVDLKVPQHTGSSAFDRAAAIRALAHPGTRPTDLVRPGHVFPLRAVDGGVLRRSGHTEAAVDLARLAGLQPAGVLAEIVHPDGTMARVPYLLQVALRHGLKIVTIKDLIAYRHQRERLVEPVSRAKMPTAFGEFTCHVYRCLTDGQEYVAFVKGDPNYDWRKFNFDTDVAKTAELAKLKARMAANADLMEAFAVVAFARAATNLGDSAPGEDEKINPYAISLDPDRWEADGLFNGDGYTLAEARQHPAAGIQNLFIEAVAKQPV